MTSANVVQYRIFDKTGAQVGKHYQSVLCKTKWPDLFKFVPLEDHTIQPWGHDEEEELWEDEPINLKEFLKDVGAI